VLFWPLDSGSGMGKKSRSGIRIRDEQPGSCFRELKNQFFGLKYLNSLIRIRDGKNSDPGETSRTATVGKKVNKMGAVNLRLLCHVPRFRTTCHIPPGTKIVSPETKMNKFSLWYPHLQTENTVKISSFCYAVVRNSSVTDP
jgi:hypothetical protein